MMKCKDSLHTDPHPLLTETKRPKEESYSGPAVHDRDTEFAHDRDRLGFNNFTSPQTASEPNRSISLHTQVLEAKTSSIKYIEAKTTPYFITIHQELRDDIYSYVLPDTAITFRQHGATITACCGECNPEKVTKCPPSWIFACRQIKEEVKERFASYTKKDLSFS